MMKDEGRNYFQPGGMYGPGGLKYRLGAKDVIQDIIDQLRGFRRNTDGVKLEDQECRLMNEVGIHAVLSFLSGVVTKVGHLTRYENEDRIMKQLRTMIGEFLTELTLNLKRWGPLVKVDIPRIRWRRYEIETPNNETILRQKVLQITEETVTVNARVKVRNKRLIVQLIENFCYQSMLRGSQGREADLTGKAHQVQEYLAPQPEKKKGFGLWGGGDNG